MKTGLPNDLQDETPARLEERRPATEQLRDARDLLTRLYREIGISAVAAALAVAKDNPARPSATVLHQPAEKHERAA